MRCNLTELPIKLEQAEFIMASVFALAGASKSKRRATAAMLVHFHKGFPTIISSGVNGTMPGESNVMENADLTLSLDTVIHAEANCLNRMEEYNMWSDDQDILFCTDSPCPNCLAYLEAEGVKTIVYAREYRLTDHLDASDIKMFCLDMDSVIQRMQHSIDRSKEVIATTPASN
ncbi:dCMP deaminase [Erwinia phage pEa_SNUABM_32]|uniref:CMP/dCMP-type deaminase domain-containing protein n=2 Tax=Alexandravirus TaxID=2733088 RepID=A0AAE8C2P7_9CAUD|nr:dCMP deaminase [Erwinia phage pEa_SNUABM_32]YP_010301149.1 dCMP deaminase [Erwinia phage pEa_SNUABM_3]QZE56573.1 hypothetical protein pEaSNUABM20_00037 [Erwinia phage pEa_SNUABM_20]QZE58252.1 hypothetical protein pEaSNUABM40_00036 [Erwinia phage pEa_SNUABM_40]UAW52818.1 hypothetical protein pEaSNUABM23_00036 [Erwinia phage pEa_SNUABM_23]UIW10714.1 hypothetical protein pEaSNUABM23_00036 [Erwinia phage pEa_SNUABM_31]QZE56233.1 hypothetical protein pEaSNUABM3_00036 [Erwinia phage pEa_SNUABM_3